MVASTDLTSTWPHLENGVECKPTAPPTSPTPQENLLTQSLVPYLSEDSNDNTESPKNLEGDGGIFAVPAVPRKQISPRRTQPAVLVRPRKSYPKKGRTIKAPLLARSPVGSPTAPAVSTEEPSEIPPPLKVTPSLKVRLGSGEESVSTMVYSIAGLLRRRNAEKLTNLTQRFGRITTFHVHHSVDNALNGGTSMFHDFLNRESFRPEARISALVSGGVPLEDVSPSKRTTKEESLLISSKASEDKSMQDLFGVLSVNKEDMKNKTSSQLMEFVKRVESNQRREAFEKQQRPAYLLKLARTQSADRSSSYITHAQNLHRAIDRTNVMDACRTESSSGGESADEAENDAYQQAIEPDHFIPVERRALYRYAKVRHAISSRYQYAHRQFARMEYGCQVMGSLLQRLQQKQGIAVFGDGALEDCKTSIRSAFPLHKDPLNPRPWDDRDVVMTSKTPNASAFLRMPTMASTTGQSLHPCPSSLLFKKKMKVSAPNLGLTYQLDTYEATMWKERLCSGKVIADGEADDWEEALDEGKEKELMECSVSSARGCARARPLSAFRKRLVVTMDSYPPKRLPQEDKPRYCDCYSRSLLPNVMGPVSCAVCMGQLPAPNWANRTQLMKASPADALSHLDRTYHTHLSQPTNRSLDAVLSGVSYDFDPSKFTSGSTRVKPRSTKWEKYLAAVKLEAQLLRAIRKKEEEIRLTQVKTTKGTSGKFSPDVGSARRNTGPRETAKVGRPKGRRPINRQGSVRKRRHSSVSSETSVSSVESCRTRSISVGSVENVKAVSKRDRTFSRTTSMSKPGVGRPRKRDTTGFDPSNYVIPYGMAAPSKIEKIQYKEIVVPKFRDLKIAPPPVTRGASATVNGDSADPIATIKVEPLDDTDTLSDEDLSDAAFILRHVPCEAEERSRFNIPEKNPRRKNVPAKSTLADGDHLSPSSNPLDHPPSANPATDSAGRPPRVRTSSTPGRKPGRNYMAKGRRDRRDSRVRVKRVVVSKAPLAEEDKPRQKRPRKTAAEISAMFPLNTRPVRARRSTFRQSPDATDP